MKSVIVVSVVLAIIGLVTGVEHDVCYGVADGIFLDNPESCEAFFSCSGGVGTAGHCPEPWYFNFLHQICDWPDNVDCTNTPDSTTTTAEQTEVPTTTTEEETEAPTTTTEEETEAPTTTTEEETEAPTTTTEEETEAPTTTEEETEPPTPESTPDVATTTEAATESPSSICYGRDNGDLVGSPDGCEFFYHCVDNLGFLGTCPPGLLFNGVHCDAEERVQCGDETTTGPTETLPISTTVSSTEEPETTTDVQTEEPSIDPNTICVGKPDGTFLNNPESCSAFFFCHENLAVGGNCPEPWYFNPDISGCDWPENVPCTDPTEEPTTEQQTTEISTATEDPAEPTETEEPSTEPPSTEEPTTEPPSTEETTTDAPLTEPPITSLCLPNDVGLKPHPSICAQYVLCFNGQQFDFTCNGGEHFSLEKRACVPRELANCRLEDPFCDPEESSIRAIYFPHPHFCNQFFACFRGSIVDLSCGPGDHWDPINSWCVAESESECVE